MNHIYRSIWNQATGAYAAVSENVRSAGKRSLPGSNGSGARFALTSMVAALMLGYGSLAMAGPTGGTVVAGQANIIGAPGATVIQQGSQNAVINWAQFNIGKGESVQFNQPNSNAVALNRVLGADGTSILGKLSANGKVFIVNPNGILFGRGASVNTAGLVASTLDISNSDFMTGKYRFSGTGTGKVLNQGSISAPGGYVALLGANVSNEGTIQARLGSVVLAAGRAITLDVAGDGLLNVTVDQGAVGALVNNGGLIQADGGSVVLTAQAAGDLLKTAVNNTGVIEAHTIDTHGGTIKLLGDMQSGTVNAAGTLDASAPTGGNGGFIDTSAAHVKLDDALLVTTASGMGLSGTWLIDPTDYTIAASGGNQTGAFFTNALKSSSVQILSVSGGSGAAGDINVNDTISWSANKLILTAQNNININKTMSGSGTASLALEYGQKAVATGNASTYNIASLVTVDLPTGNNFSTKLGNDGGVTTYKVINSLGAAGSLTGNDLQGINGALSGNYVLGSNIDARATSAWNGGSGFSPIGRGNTPLGTANATPFAGQFDGLGHVVTGLTINRTNTAVGLFGGIGSGASVSNLGLVGGSVTGSSPVFLGDYASAGMLAGVNRGKVNNVYATGAVNGSGYMRIGGLVGQNYGTINNSQSGGAVVLGGTVMLGGNYGAGGLVGLNRAGGLINNSSASGAVSSSLAHAGGLVFYNLGTISNSFATGAVSAAQSAGGLVAQSRYGGVIQSSFATGTVNGNNLVGGLVGWNDNGSQINNSYATGSVIGTNSPTFGSAQFVGGLVGQNSNSSQVRNSYATGAVSGTSTIGGVVGINTNNSTVTNVYASGLVTGASNTGGVIGQNSSASLSNGYFNSTLNPTRSVVGFADGSGTGSGGGSGLTATQMKTASNFAGFNFTTTPGATGNNWVLVDTDGTLNNAGGVLGGTGPMLASEYSTSISSAHQLQLMAMNLAGNYTLNYNLNAAGTGGLTDVWNGSTFIPVGSNSSKFTGSLNGNGHYITGLVVNRPGIDYAGLFGVIGSGGSVSNLGMEGGSISGGNNVGALAGLSQGTLSGNYSTVAVSGTNQVGGMAGTNSGTMNNDYASGTVNGSAQVGGLVGSNLGSIGTSYANGAVSGVTATGGLAGANIGSVGNSYWDIGASGQADSAGGTGLSNANMKNLANYLSWDLSNTWIVYDGYSTPLLRAFLKPLTVNADNVSKTYDGIAYSGGSASYSTVYDNTLLGSASYGGNGLGAVNAGDYALSVGGFYSTGQHGYAVTNVDGVLSVAKRALSLSGGVAANKVYDGTYNAIINGVSLNGVLAGDIGLVNLLLSGMFSSSKNVGNGLAVSSSASLGGSAASNYTVSQLSGLSANITPKQLSISGLVVGNKVYDGTTAASLSGGVLSGMVDGESIGLSGLAGHFDDKNAGNGKSVVLNPMTLLNGGGGGRASNYSLTIPTGLLADITRASISSVSGIVAGNKVYDGTQAASLNVTGASFAGIVGGDNLTVENASGSFSDKNAANGKTVNINGIVLGGTDAGNYTLSNVTASSTANISAKTLTLTGLNGNKVYDGTVNAPLSGGSLNGLVAGETLGFSGSVGAFSDKSVGNGKPITVSGVTLADGTGLAGNYTVSNPGGVTGNITKATITDITGLAALDKIYNGNLNVSLSPALAVINGMIAGDDVQLFSASGAFTDKNVGNGKTVNITNISLSGSDLGNYNFIKNTAAATANITPRTLMITGLTGNNKVYDGTTTAVLSGGTLSGMVAGETLGFSGSVGAFVDKNAGNGKAITVSGVTLANGTGLASNYTVGNPTGLTASITPKALTLNGLVAGNKVYDGNAIASLSGGALDGLVAGETLDIAGQTASFSDKNAGNNKAVTVTGTALVDTASGLAGNYTISNPTGLTASITPKALTLSGVVAGNKVYDGNAIASLSGGVLDGLVAGEALSFAGKTGSFSDKNAGNGKAVTVTGTALVDTASGLASNYTVSDPTGLTASITPKALTLSGVVAGNKVYDGNAIASLSGGALDGLVAGETLGIAGQTASFSDKNAGNSKAVTVTGTSLVDTASGLAGNYTVSNPVSLTANITPLAISGISGIAAVGKVYDGTTNAGLNLARVTFDGMLAGDNLALGSTVSGAFSDKNAAAGKTVFISGLGLGGQDAGNYVLASNTATTTADITRASLFVSATATNRVYDATTGASVTLSDNRIGNDHLTITTSGASFSDKNVGTGKTVTVNSITVSGADAGNYTVNGAVSTTATITQAAMTVKVDDAEKEQGRVNPPFSASYAGLLGSDTLAGEMSGNLAFSTSATTGSAAGNYRVSASGQSASNYALNYVDGMLKVSPAETPRSTISNAEALQSAIASAITATNLVPSQGGMVASGEVQEAQGDTEQGAGSGAPVAQLVDNVVNNVLPGLRLSVVSGGLRLPTEGDDSGNRESQ